MNSVDIRSLSLADLDRLLAYLVPHLEQSGSAGEPVYAPYSAGHKLDATAMRAKFEETWPLPLSAPGWKRAWGAYEGNRIVGHVMLHGPQLPSEMHRARLGMGVHRDYRRQGIATQLLRAAIQWASTTSELAWLDLGVFSDNDPARTLYEKLGFRQTGVVRDRFRVDGHSVDDIQMTLSVPSRPR